MMNPTLSAPCIDYTGIDDHDAREDMVVANNKTHPFTIYAHGKHRDFPIHGFATEKDAERAWTHLEAKGAKSLAYIAEMTVHRG